MRIFALVIDGTLCFESQWEKHEVRTVWCTVTLCVVLWLQRQVLQHADYMAIQEVVLMTTKYQVLLQLSRRGMKVKSSSRIPFDLSRLPGSLMNRMQAFITLPQIRSLMLQLCCASMTRHDSLVYQLLQLTWINGLHLYIVIGNSVAAIFHEFGLICIIVPEAYQFFH